MEIETGKFYFIKDDFFNNFNIKMMKNKSNGNKRPCFFCFRDKKYNNILWFVPVSTKVEKYEQIYNQKIKKYKTVYNFVFGNLHGKRAVFLIQNIFPTTEEYIIEKYITENIDVVIPKILANEIISTANKVVKLAKGGVYVCFYDIIKMRDALLEKELIKN